MRVRPANRTWHERVLTGDLRTLSRRARVPAMSELHRDCRSGRELRQALLEQRGGAHEDHRDARTGDEHTTTYRQRIGVLAQLGLEFTGFSLLPFRRRYVCVIGLIGYALVHR